MPRIKTRPNLRQQYRELLDRADTIGVKAKLARGYLYITDNVSKPNDEIEYKLWADDKNLPKFRKIVEFAEQIAAERNDVIMAFESQLLLFEKIGLTFGELNPSAWWFQYEIGQQCNYLPLLKSSQRELYLLAASLIAKQSPPS